MLSENIEDDDLIADLRNKLLKSDGKRVHLSSSSTTTGEDVDYLKCYSVPYVPIRYNAEYKKCKEICLVNDSIAPDFFYPAGDFIIVPQTGLNEEYQNRIIKTCVYNNTLMCLPKGCGSTFIAACLIYNYNHWYPVNKCVYLAPNEESIKSQMKMSFAFTKIPFDDSMYFTDDMSADSRAKIWNERHIFFMTPELFWQDLNVGICNMKDIRLVVCDEGHVTDMYEKILQFLKPCNYSHRVVSIIPIGALKEDIKLTNQYLKLYRSSRMEIETPYTCSSNYRLRVVEKIPVKLNCSTWTLRKVLLQIYEKYVRKLKEHRVLPGNFRDITESKLVRANQDFINNIPFHIPLDMVDTLKSHFYICLHLLKCLNLLTSYGIAAVHDVLSSYIDQSDVKNILDKDESFLKLLMNINALMDDTSENRIFSHSKLRALHDRISKYVKCHQFSSESSSIKILVYCENVAMMTEIRQVLNTIDTIQVAVLDTDKSKFEGLNQPPPDQIRTMFENHGLNALITTSIDGLRTDNVDVIVCFEPSATVRRIVTRSSYYEAPSFDKSRIGYCYLILTTDELEEYDACIPNNLDVPFDVRLKRSTSIQTTLMSGPRNPLIPKDVCPQFYMLKYDDNEPKKIKKLDEKIKAMQAGLSVRSRKLIGFNSPPIPAIPCSRTVDVARFASCNVSKYVEYYERYVSDEPGLPMSIMNALSSSEIKCGDNVSKQQSKEIMVLMESFDKWVKLTVDNNDRVMFNEYLIHLLLLLIKYESQPISTRDVSPYASEHASEMQYIANSTPKKYFSGKLNEMQNYKSSLSPTNKYFDMYTLNKLNNTYFNIIQPCIEEVGNTWNNNEVKLAKDEDVETSAFDLFDSSEDELFAKVDLNVPEISDDTFYDDNHSPAKLLSKVSFNHLEMTEKICCNTLDNKLINTPVANNQNGSNNENANFNENNRNILNDNVYAPKGINKSHGNDFFDVSQVLISDKNEMPAIDSSNLIDCSHFKQDDCSVRSELVNDKSNYIAQDLSTCFDSAFIEDISNSKSSPKEIIRNSDSSSHKPNQRIPDYISDTEVKMEHCENRTNFLKSQASNVVNKSRKDKSTSNIQSQFVFNDEYMSNNVTSTSDAHGLDKCFFESVIENSKNFKIERYDCISSHLTPIDNNKDTCIDETTTPCRPVSDINSVSTESQEFEDSDATYIDLKIDHACDDDNDMDTIEDKISANEDKDNQNSNDSREYNGNTNQSTTSDTVTIRKCYVKLPRLNFLNENDGNYGVLNTTEQRVEYNNIDAVSKKNECCNINFCLNSKNIGKGKETSDTNSRIKNTDIGYHTNMNCSSSSNLLEGKRPFWSLARTKEIRPLTLKCNLKRKMDSFKISKDIKKESPKSILTKTNECLDVNISPILKIIPEVQTVTPVSQKSSVIKCSTPLVNHIDSAPSHCSIECGTLNTEGTSLIVCGKRKRFQVVSSSGSDSEINHSEVKNNCSFERKIKENKKTKRKELRKAKYHDLIEFEAECSDDTGCLPSCDSYYDRSASKYESSFVDDEEYSYERMLYRRFECDKEEEIKDPEEKSKSQESDFSNLGGAYETYEKDSFCIPDSDVSISSDGSEVECSFSKDAHRNAAINNSSFGSLYLSSVSDDSNNSKDNDLSNRKHQKLSDRLAKGVRKRRHYQRNNSKRHNHKKSKKHKNDKQKEQASSDDEFASSG